MKRPLIILALFMYLFSINSYGQINRNAVADTNVILPPAWAFGVLYGGYTNQQQTIETIKKIIKHDYPIDAYWIDSWFWDHGNKGRGPKKYIDFVADTIGYPNRKAMWSFMQQQQIKGGFWVWDCIFETGNEAAFKEFLDNGYFRNTYYESNPWHNNSTTTAMHETNAGEKKGTLCGNINFDDPKAVAYFKQKMQPFFDEGADFLKLDRTAAIPVCKAMFEITQELGKETKGRGFILSHTGGQESEEYKRYPTKWTDDTRSDWTIENPLIKFDTWVPKVALKENIAMFTHPNSKSSQIPFLTNDLGGFDMGKTIKPEEELYIRWLQFSMFNPITEVFSQPENPTGNLAWKYSSRADELFKQYAHLRMQLFPYIYSYAHQTRLLGKNIIRPIEGHLYQYLFGNEILVAPVYEKGQTMRTVFLPEGEWVNYWMGEELQGNKNHNVAAPISQIPLFVRQGAIIPMRKYYSSIEKGNNDTLELHIYPGDNSTFNLIEDDGTSNDYLKGKYAVTKMELVATKKKNRLTILPIEGGYQTMHTNRTWEINLHTTKKLKGIKYNGKNISYKKSGNTICTSFTTSIDKIAEVTFSY